MSRIKAPKNIFCIVFCFFSLISNNLIAFAQREGSLSKFKTYERRIDSLIIKRDYKSAIKLLNKTITYISDSKPEQLQLANLYNKLSHCQLKKGKLKESKKNTEKALELSLMNGQPNIEEATISYYQIGDFHFANRDISNALNYYHKSLDFYKNREGQNTKILSKIHRNIARCHVNNRNIELTERHLNSALVFLQEDIAENGQGLAEYYYLKGNSKLSNAKYTEAEKALNLFFKTVFKQKEPDKKLMSEAYSTLGSLYRMRSDFNKAIENFEKSQKILSAEFKDDYKGQAFNNRILSDIYASRAEYNKAIAHNNMALTTYKQIYGDTHPRIGLCYGTQAQIYEKMKRFNESLDKYLKALDILKTTKGESHIWTVTTNANIGGIYFALEDYENSKIYLDKSIEAGEGIFGLNNIRMTQFYVLLAQTLNSLNKKNASIDLLEKTLSIAQSSYPEKHYEIINIYNTIGEIYLENNEFKDALPHFEKVIKSHKSEIEIILKEKYASGEFIILSEILFAIIGKGNCLLSKYQTDDSYPDLEAANALFNKAQVIGEKVRKGIVNHEDRMRLNSILQPIAKRKIETLILLNKKKNSSNLIKAFNTSEKYKAKGLRELLFRNNVQNINKPLVKIKRFEDSLKDKRVTILSKIKNKTEGQKDTTKLKEYEKALFSVNNTYDSLLVSIRKNHPKYYYLEHLDKLLSISEIKKKLGDNTTLLEYFISDNTIFTFIVSKDFFQVEKLPVRSLKKNIEELQTSITSKNTQVFNEKSSELYKQLVAPIAHNIKNENLIVIPDGFLWHLNFDLLLTAQSDSNNPRDLPFLLKKHAISYANSINYLFESNGFVNSESVDCLAFSFSDSLNIEYAKSISLNTLRNSKKDLPGSRKEITEIANLVSGEYFYGSSASEANFKSKANQFGILHLALHGKVDHYNPENSKLYFTKGENKTEDNLLYSYEIFALNLPSELTVLSACSSGSGKTMAGEGIMSLGNSFQYAGSKSLLMTHWDVSDEVTPEVMKFFYTNLKEGMNKAKALQQAKLMYLENADTFKSGPFYWGSFYLVGDTSPISLGNPNRKLHLILSCVVLVISLFFLRQYFRKKRL